ADRAAGRQCRFRTGAGRRHARPRPHAACRVDEVARAPPCRNCCVGADDRLPPARSSMNVVEWPDLLTIALLVLLEGVLSGDNALVLAVIVLPLPEEQQRKALQYGMIGAFVL